MTLKDAILLEDNRILKFYYKHHKHDKFPEVFEFDAEYPGREWEKNYGKRKDLLGWNLNYYGNKEDAIESLHDIVDFAKLLGKDKLDTYKRVKKLFPDQAKLLRRYKKSAIKYLRIKDKDGLWHKEGAL